MKKCPNCQREFPDSMRFCQTDGTPLVEAVEVQAEDPLKTTVVRQDEIASAIPPADPFKTVVAGAPAEKEEEDDVLQLPEEFDPLKTMVVPPVAVERPVPGTPAEPVGFEGIKEEIMLETPPVSAPVSKPPVDPGFGQPQPPQFSDPVVPAPSFDPASADDDLPATMIQNSIDASAFSVPEPPAPSFNPPAPSFDPPAPSFEPPAPSFEPPAPSFDPPAPSFDPPAPSFDPPAPSFDPPAPTPFQPTPFQPEPASPFQPVAFEEPKPAASPFDPTPFQTPEQSQPMQAAEWTPPPAPVAGWQEHQINANTPFQPPVAGSPSSTLAIVSLIAGIVALLSAGGMIIPFLGIICLGISFLSGAGAIVTGFLARSKAKNDPANFGGGGMALGGIILGALSILAIVGLFVVGIALGIAGGLMR